MSFTLQKPTPIEVRLFEDATIFRISQPNFQKTLMEGHFGEKITRLIMEAAFIDKQNKVYRIPYEETILAFVDLSAGEECKYGLAFGLKGMYVNNAGLSTSRGPRYISYTVYKNNELRQIIKKELQIEFKAIEIKRLEKEDQATLEKILREIKSKLLQ